MCAFIPFLQPHNACFERHLALLCENVPFLMFVWSMKCFQVHFHPFFHSRSSVLPIEMLCRRMPTIWKWYILWPATSKLMSMSMHFSSSHLRMRYTQANDSSRGNKKLHFSILFLLNVSANCSATIFCVMLFYRATTKGPKYFWNTKVIKITKT